MLSNSKLTETCKEWRKTLKEILQNVNVVNNGETTVAYRTHQNTVEFALSVASPNEKKFRRKVGEFYALNRFYDGQTQKMASHDFFYMMQYTLSMVI